MLKTYRLITLGLAGLGACSASAQWVSQLVPLHPGWNAIFLEVQPEPRDCEKLFAGIPIESVWHFNRTLTTLQFIDDPNKLVPNQPDWLTYLPPSHPLTAQSRLLTIEGGKAYLIKLADNAPTTTWQVRGIPATRQPKWLADSFNLVGFPLATNNPPTFQSFLGHSPALATNAVYRLSADGVWVRLNSPATTAMQRGESFWVRATGPCDYGGTLSVEMERSKGLDFGQFLTEQTVRIHNTSTSPTTIVVQQVDSEAPGSPEYPVVAGTVPFSYWTTNLAGGAMGWANLPAVLSQANIPPGGSWELRLAVRRRDMAVFTPPAGVSNALYQCLLAVSDGSTRLVLPVTANGLSDFGSRNALAAGGAGRTRKGGSGAADRTGLWIGSASLSKVNQPNGASPNVPAVTGSSFEFRLLVHVDDQGQTRLLQKVLQRWLNGTTKPAGANSTNLVVDQPGRFVLLTDEKLALQPQFSGAALRDGQEVGRRYSTAAFSFTQPIPMTGTGEFGSAASVYSAQVIVGYDDPLNPFVHRYHPDHDNLSDRSGNDGKPLALPVRDNGDGRGAYTAESYTVTRTVELHFSDVDPDRSTLPGWGDTRVGGIYRETILGLHNAPVIAEGTFRLVRASSVGVLNQ